MKVKENWIRELLAIVVSFAENKSGASWSVHAIYLHISARTRVRVNELFIWFYLFIVWYTIMLLWNPSIKSQIKIFFFLLGRHFIFSFVKYSKNGHWFKIQVLKFLVCSLPNEACISTYSVYLLHILIFKRYVYLRVWHLQKKFTF